MQLVDVFSKLKFKGRLIISLRKRILKRYRILL